MATRQRQKQTVQVLDDVEVSIEQEQVSHHAVGPVEGAELQRTGSENIRERIEDHREVFVLIGLPGAGKSTVADIIEEEHDENVTSFEVSDFVRAKYEDEMGDTTDDNSLGAWAAERKDEEGQDVFVDELARTIKTPTTPHVIISGVRSPEEAVAVEEVFGSCTTVGIWTLPDLRFNRKYGDWPDVDHEKWDTFCERNERELWEWRAIEFFSMDSDHEADYIIPNNGDIDRLRTNIQKFLNGEGSFDENPFPYGDFEKVAQYL